MKMKFHPIFKKNSNVCWVSLFVFFLFFNTSLLSADAFPAAIKQDFDVSMASFKGYNQKVADTKPMWCKIRNIYNTCFKNKKTFSKQPRIPKIIHQIWLGSPLPQRYREFAATWKKHHPDWQYKLWTDKDIEEFKLVNKAKFDIAHHYGDKANIARYEILYRLGGVYADSDFECFKPFDIFHHCCDFFVGCVGIDPYDNFDINNAVIGSMPHHPILKTCIEAITLNKNNSTSSLARTGPYHLKRHVERYLARMKNPTDQSIIIFPVSYFYAWPPNKQLKYTRLQIEQWVKPESYAIHHWDAAWGKNKLEACQE